MDLAVGDDHDLVEEGGDLVEVTGAADTVSQVEDRILTIVAEWFLDDTIGCIDFDKWFGKNVSLSYIRAKLVTEIEATPGIVGGSAVVDSVAVVASERQLTISWRATAIDGEPLGSTVTGP